MRPLLRALWAFFEPFVEVWSSISPRRRVFLILSGLSIFGGIWAFRWFMIEWTYRPLYTDLTDQEAGSAVARLQELGAPYKLASAGSTILVPEDRLAELRLQLASDGLPQHGRLGFELFDQTSFGATEFAEQVNFRRALEGELARSILSLAEVERARVHISLPKQSVFLDYEQPAKAAVVLQLRRAAALSKPQTDGIAYLVASAVEGLQPGKVVIVDSHGSVLARPKPGGQESSDEQLDYRRKIESDTERRILATLEPYVGFDKARANVAADVDWNEGEQTEEVLDPSTLVMTTQKSEETTQPARGSGVPGTASNLPRQPLSPGRDGVINSRTMETTNYQTSRTVTRMDLERGVVKRLSVAVLVDSKSEWDESAEELIRTPRTEQEMASLRQLVIAAAGIVEQRGDVLTIESLPFTIFEAPPPGAFIPGVPVSRPSFEFSLEWVQKYRYELIAAAVLALFLTVVMLWGLRRYRLRARIRADREAAMLAEQERHELEAAEEDARRKEVEEARMLKGLKMASLQSSKAQVLKKHLEETASKDTDSFVQLLRSWIHEDDK